jgi:hypothetical protein
MKLIYRRDRMAGAVLSLLGLSLDGEVGARRELIRTHCNLGKPPNEDDVWGAMSSKKKKKKKKSKAAADTLYPAAIEIKEQCGAGVNYYS